MPHAETSVFTSDLRWFQVVIYDDVYVITHPRTGLEFEASNLERETWKMCFFPSPGWAANGLYNAIYLTRGGFIVVVNPQSKQ